MLSKAALIGYTGFVGGNLAKQFSFDDGYNSKNIEDIKGKGYDLIISAGARADRSEANLNPKGDWEGINRLLSNLREVRAKHFVLISTIDVYPDKNGVDEDASINLEDLTEAYGQNRYRMEIIIRKNFPKTTIVRLPNLIGKNLKKNFIYDLIHKTGLELRHKDSLLQYYNLKNIWKDIQTALKHRLALINFAVEPITAHDIALYTLGIDFQDVTDKPPFQFDFRTKYGKLYGSDNGYLYHREEILDDLKKFIKDERRKLKK